MVDVIMFYIRFYSKHMRVRTHKVIIIYIEVATSHILLLVKREKENLMYINGTNIYFKMQFVFDLVLLFISGLSYFFLFLVAYCL